VGQSVLIEWDDGTQANNPRKQGFSQNNVLSPKLNAVSYQC